MSDQIQRMRSTSTVNVRLTSKEKEQTGCKPRSLLRRVAERVQGRPRGARRKEQKCKSKSSRLG